MLNDRLEGADGGSIANMSGHLLHRDCFLKLLVRLAIGASSCL